MMEAPIIILPGRLQIFGYCVLSIDVPITDANLLQLNIDGAGAFNIAWSYSVDKQNYSVFADKQTLIDNTATLGVEFFIRLEFTRIDLNDKFDTVTNTLYPETVHIDNSISIELSVDDGLTFIDFSVDVDSYKIISDKELLLVKPLWNLYDNQQMNIKQWLAQCSAITAITGMTVIYFKTEPIESETVHTFNNHTFRNVTAIKKINIDIPDNEIPQDTITFTDDYSAPLSGEFRVQINKNDFEQAFGETALPYEGDYLFLPMYNRLYSVSVSQPPPGNERFMGVIAWWETYLCKYESNESILIKPELSDEMSVFPEFNLAIDTMPTATFDIQQKIFDEVAVIFDTSVDTADKVMERTIIEKNKATEGYTNKLVDSTFYVSPKETEKHREFLHKRLSIVTVNPDSEAFPVTMYDCTPIPKRTVGLQYKLSDYTVKSKIQLTPKQTWELSFNFVLTQKISSEFVSLMTDGILTVCTLMVNRNYLEIVDNRNGWLFRINSVLELNEFYNISLVYDITNKQYIVNLKVLGSDTVFTDLAINTDVVSVPLIFSNIQLFGGTWLQSETIFNIDNKQVMKDYVNPILRMNNF